MTSGMTSGLMRLPFLRRRRVEARQEGRLRVIVTFLEMTAPPQREAGAPPLPAARLRLETQPSVAFYRHLYNTVGEDWLWHEQRRVSDQKLVEALNDPRVVLLIAEVGEETAGFAELDRRNWPVVHIAYFGLMPAFIGKKLGPWLLDHALALAWSGGTTKVKLNTCTFDHPKALPMYQSRGLKVVYSVARLVLDPRLDGTLPRHAAPHIPLASLGNGRS